MFWLEERGAAYFAVWKWELDVPEETKGKFNDSRLKYMSEIISTECILVESKIEWPV